MWWQEAVQFNSGSLSFTLQLCTFYPSQKSGELIWSYSGLKYLVLQTFVLLLENLRSINEFAYQTFMRWWCWFFDRYHLWHGKIWVHIFLWCKLQECLWSLPKEISRLTRNMDPDISTLSLRRDLSLLGFFKVEMQWKSESYFRG